MSRLRADGTKFDDNSLRIEYEKIYCEKHLTPDKIGVYALKHLEKFIIDSGTLTENEFLNYKTARLQHKSNKRGIK